MNKLFKAEGLNLYVLIFFFIEKYIIVNILIIVNKI